jgi:uncharacterized RDD family membrane protein YckC
MSHSAGGIPQPGSGHGYGPQVSWTAADEAYLKAADLSARLRSSGKLPPLDTAIVLEPGESAVYCDKFTEYVYSTARVSYTSGFVAAFGSPAWLAASLGGSALYNNYQRTKAEAKAAAQWRIADQGLIHVTDQRLCLQGRLAWAEFPLGAIRALDALPDGVVIHRQGQSPVKIATAAVAYLYVLLSFFVTGQVISVPLPPDFIERARRAGRYVQVQGFGISAEQSSDSWQGRAGMPLPPWPAPEASHSMPYGVGHSRTETTSKVDVLGRPYADWGTRAAAALIDFIVVLVGCAVFVAAAVAGASLRTPPGQYGQGGISGAGITVIALSLVALAAFFFGYHLLHGSGTGQTLGKRIVAIQVRDAQTGGRISYARAFGRYLAQVFAWLILPILVFVDLLWPLWDDRLQTLHDKAVNTVVIKVERD